MNTNSIRNISMSVALALIAAFFSIRNPAFISPQNLSNLSIELAVTATLALGMLLVLLPGMIDLSAGSGVGMLGGIAAVLVFKPGYILGLDLQGFPAWFALLLSLLVALGIWGSMGALIIKQKVPAFIITLGGLLIFNGIHWFVIRDSTIPVTPGGTDNLYSLLTTYYFGPNAYALD